MIDAVGRVKLGCPITWDRDPFPTVYFDVKSVIGDVKLGRMRYNYAPNYKAEEAFVRMTFVPDNKMLIYPECDPGRSMALLEDILVLGILAGTLDTITTFGVGKLIPYNVIRDYGSEINKEINAASLSILTKYGFSQDSDPKKGHIYLYTPNVQHLEKIDAYKKEREKMMKAEMLDEARRILQKI